MCATCGCSDHSQVTMTDPVNGERSVLSHAEAHARGVAHEHSHADHQHSHRHGLHESHRHPLSGAPVAAAAALAHQKTIELERDILGKNQQLANRNRRWFLERGILALNLVSSPGSGKTTLLERTVLDLRSETEINVIEGDQETAADAERIRATGCRAVQINTGAGCHLEADMVAHALPTLAPKNHSLLFIENVGNLVCPALFDLGESSKVAILSVTEGEDKPLKYPHMFRASDIMILNKIDLLPYVRFDVARCIAYAREVNPQIEVFQLSATTAAGIGSWYGWLRGKLHAAQQ